MQPKWNPEIREWVLEIPMHDKDAGDYVQVFTFEALISAQNFINELNKGKTK